MHRASRTARRTGRPGTAGGFTIVELMTTLVVVAVLFAIAVPTFRNVSLGPSLSATANDLVASVQLARSEAIKRNATITLCASSDGTTCAGSGGWEQGWIVRDAGGAVYQRVQAQDSGYHVTQSGGTLPLSFQPIGIGASAAVFTVCRYDPLGTQERVVSMRASGQSYVTHTETGTCS